MTCSTFREQHSAFMDGELDPVELASMERHLAECATCAAHDSVVRRAVLLVRNLPCIEPSAGFSSRLEARLGGLSDRPSEKGPAKMRPYFATAVGVAAVGYLAVLAFREPTRDHISAFRPLAVAASEPSAPSPSTPQIVSVQEPRFVALQPAFNVVGSADTFTTQLPTPPIMPFGRADLPGAWSRRSPLRLDGGQFTTVRLTR
jgi:hypothetical protein